MPPIAAPPATPRPPGLQTPPPLDIKEVREDRPLPGWMVLSIVIQGCGLVVVVGLLIGGLTIYVQTKKDMITTYPY